VRRAAGLSSNSLEASINRSLTEPGVAGRDRVEATLVIYAALRLFAGRLLAMQLGPRLGTKLSPDALAAWHDWISGAMKALAWGQPR
jgi:hypothetical protein